MDLVPQGQAAERAPLIALALGLAFAACAVADGDSDGANSNTNNTDIATGDDSSPDSDSPTEEDETDDGASTDEVPVGGLGCGPPPPCDRGESSEAIIGIASAEDIDKIAGYTKIRGNLEIAGTDLECLDFLACLEEVGGDLKVFDNNWLLDVSGTDTLRRLGTEFAVAGSLVVTDNDLLEDVDGFNRLLSTSVHLSIQRNDSLKQISGLRELELVEEDLVIRFNPELTSLSGLRANLKGVLGGFVVVQNPQLCLSEVNRLGGNLEAGPDVARTSTDSNADC